MRGIDERRIWSAVAAVAAAAAEYLRIQMRLLPNAIAEWG
jgi:hypothetical protein